MKGKGRGPIVIALDQANSLSFSVGGVLRDELSDFDVVIPALESRGGHLEDQIVPSFSSADTIIVVWSATDPLWSAFQSGLAGGMARPVLNVAFDPPAMVVARGAPVDVDLMDDRYDVRRAVEALPSEVDPRSFKPGSVLLCPDETGDDAETVSQLRRALPRRTFRPATSRSRTVCDDVLWVITPYGVNARSGEWSNLAPNVRAAYEAGRHYGGALAAGAVPKLAIARVGVAPTLLALEHLVVARAQTAAELVSMLDQGHDADAIRLIGLELIDVKCFKKIVVPLSVDSPLGGAWTCIAGVNGAGKSTILQAIALGLLGRRRAVELGLGRLNRMVRRSDRARGGIVRRAEIRLTVRVGSDETVLTLPLDESGPDEQRLMSLTDLPKMERVWSALGRTLVVSYGATRNLTDSPATQQDRSPMAQRQLTLFDSLAQIVSSEALIVGGIRFRPALQTLARMLTAVLSEPGRPFDCSVDADGRLRFARGGATLDSLDLPDGFRSMVALLADVSQGWHELHPDDAEPGLAQISGIVLVDELDLHLHAQLQRQVVTRLRSALPHIQWVITTHSPLIVTSFESSELIVLDRGVPGGIKQLDREVLGFSANEVYDWLLDTRPVSSAGAEQLAADAGTDLLYQSPTLDAAHAKQLADMQNVLLAELSATKA